jgi:hypothetical protein
MSISYYFKFPAYLALNNPDWPESYELALRESTTPDKGVVFLSL